MKSIKMNFGLLLLVTTNLIVQLMELAVIRNTPNKNVYHQVSFGTFSKRLLMSLYNPLYHRLSLDY